MPRLLTLLFALFVPSVRRVRRDGPTSGSHSAHPDKPLFDLLAEALFDTLATGLAAARRWAGDASAVVQGWTAAAVDPTCPTPVVAPCLASGIGRQAPGPSRLPLVGSTGRCLLDGLESRFAPRWPNPGHARMAAGLFMTAIALICAGVVGIVAVLAPSPGVHLQRVRGAASVAVVAPGADAPLPAPSAAPAAVDTAPAAAAPAAEPAPPAEPPVPPAIRGALPVGKGMWIWLHERAEGGDPAAIVQRAKEVGLTHLYVRTGTLKEGFMAAGFLDRLLPVAHANGIRVYGWDFPYLKHPGADVDRAVAAIEYTTPDGHRIDGFSADIESTREGTTNEIVYVNAYVTWLRGRVGPNYPLIATIPNPTPAKVASGFPYAQVVSTFDAVAPMVYWMNRDPASDVANAIAYLSQFGKPVFPVGQAYDGGPEGGPPGVPGRDQLIRFMQAADQHGSGGVSFWSWQHATQEAWDAVRDAAEFRLVPGGPSGEGLTPGMVRAYQLNLTSLGFPVAADGVWGPATVEAVLNYQRAARLAPSGHVDAATRDFLLAPVAAPIQLQ
ncbi:MAG: peptidoglycan-binding protein [Actinobacteria bacterium]|nr:peptidoglycan-binding protein [Actinomycetota bacterium]